MGIPQRAWQWICLQPCRRAFIAPPVASFGMHIDSCTGDVRARVHIPPQPINETAIQINVFSSGVAIMVEALGLKHGTAHGTTRQHCACSKPAIWLGEIIVSLFFQLSGATPLRRVGYAPTISPPWFLSAGLRKLPCGRRERETAPDHPAKHAKRPLAAPARRRPAAICPHGAAVLNTFRTLALKVQWTRIATGAVMVPFRRRTAGHGDESADTDELEDVIDFYDE